MFVYIWGWELVFAALALFLGASGLRLWQGLAFLAVATALRIVLTTDLYALVGASLRRIAAERTAEALVLFAIGFIARWLVRHGKRRQRGRRPTDRPTVRRRWPSWKRRTRS